ncbi:SCO family protein [Neobacillus ginsengisoli]|uniref:Protein SCO1/2 n=1 Tax=Neobacillus ginsengisoli TaxID=904295 RepID=A0ABT9XS28_9BACI|nr:SCO family protein [Neobacillus ginsengisoli]MDQ0197744.1 protein SCO1/2 [Neobacillus ginsengisoli]
MKKIYLICSLAVFLGIAGGISFFLIRDANATIPSSTLVNQNGDSYKLGQDHSKLKLVEFIYTHCPDICPTTTQKMSLLKKDLEKKGLFGKNIEFITISIDPYRDTPEVLKGYMKGFGIKDDGHWEFLTGEKQTIKKDQEKIREIANSLQFQYKDPGDGQFIHSTFTYLVDKNNKFIAKFPMGKEFNKQDVYNNILDKIN